MPGTYILDGVNVSEQFSGISLCYARKLPRKLSLTNVPSYGDLSPGWKLAILGNETAVSTQIEACPNILDEIRSGSVLERQLPLHP